MISVSMPYILTDFGGKVFNMNVDELERAGIKTPEQIVLTSDCELSRVGNLSKSDVKYIKKYASETLLPGGFTNAYEVKKKQDSLGKLSIGCPVLDEYLRGGFRPRSLIEIYGESGCGKTQIALQIAANCWSNGAVYICTEDVFPSKRLQQIFKTVDDKQLIKQDINKYGEKIFVMHNTEVDSLKQCLSSQLPRLLASVKTISLIIIDSIAAPFRGEFQDDFKRRAHHLREIGVILLGQAQKYNLSVMCLNQVSANMNCNETSNLLPCLGVMWSNMITTRIRVMKTNKFYHVDNIISDHNISGGSEKHNVRRTSIEAAQLNMLQIREFKIVFSPELPSNVAAEYIITSHGVIGISNT